MPVRGRKQSLANLTDVTLTSPLNGQFLKYNGSVWVNDSVTVGGSGDSVVIDVSQVGHGLSVQEAVYFDGTDWQKARADNIDTIGKGLVSTVTDADTFKVTLSGKVTGLSGLVSGEEYYVSDATAGLITTTESNIYSNPILEAISTTEAIVTPYRAQDLGGSIYTVTRSEYDSANKQYLYTGKAVPGSATSATVWRISRYSFIDGIITYADGNQNYDNVWDNRQSLTYS